MEPEVQNNLIFFISKFTFYRFLPQHLIMLAQLGLPADMKFQGWASYTSWTQLWFFIFKKCKYDFKTNSRYGRAIAQRDLFYNFLCRKNYIPSPTFYKLYFSPATNRIYTCKSKILRQLWQFCAHTSIFFPPELLLSYFRPPPQW